ncbi:NAD(P)/FAD-dependent oxidoreductase [Roseibium sp. M-1]
MKRTIESDSYDFAVIGGGVVGLAIAYGLLRSGKRVVILDEGDVAMRASRGNFALVWLQSKGFGLPEYSRLTQRSISLWAGFADMLRDETGIDVSLSQAGGFLLYLDEQALQAHVKRLSRLADQLGSDRFPVSVMAPNELREAMPAIGHEVVGGTFCPLDGHVNALRLFHTVHSACLKRGATYLANAAVTRIDPSPSDYRLATQKGELRAEKIVLAAGLGNVDLAPMVGLTAPLRPERGQLLVTEKLDKILPYPVGTLRQTDEGGVMIGASKEDAGYDTRTTPDVLAGLAADAVRMFPVLARARIVRTWSALRIMSPDEFPIYDQSFWGPGAYLVTCHSGITLAAAHALDLAPSIATGGLAQKYNVFSPKRFSNVQTVA